MAYVLTKNNIKVLRSFADIFLKWQAKMNLVSNPSIPYLWERHILDSVQLFPYVRNSTVLDLGSGGGFPALILALLDGEEKSSKFYLAEKDKKKSVFLHEMIRIFSLNAEVINMAIEDIKPFKFNIITSRALAEVEKLLTLSQNLLHNDTILYLMKGKSVDRELEKARLKYDFDIEKIPSETDKEGCILKVTNCKKK